MRTIARKLLLTLAAMAVAAVMSCGGMEPQDEVDHYIVDLKTGDRVAHYVGDGMYELINNRIPAEHLWKLYPQHVWMAMGEEPNHVSAVGDKRRQKWGKSWAPYAEKKE